MTIQDAMNSQELSKLDLSKVAALQQKRTIAFVNHFVLTTVQFLNDFMKKCEFKLMKFERKLEKVEAAMVLLEARLSSIPEVNIETELKSQEQPLSEPANPQTADQNDNTPAQNETPEERPPETEPAYPEYERFIKMVQVGVPLEAVKLKVSIEGLDPNIFAKIMGR